MSSKIDFGLDGEAKSVSGVELCVTSTTSKQLHSKSLRLASAPQHGHTSTKHFTFIRLKLQDSF